MAHAEFTAERSVEVGDVCRRVTPKVGYLRVFGQNQQQIECLRCQRDRLPIPQNTALVGDERHVAELPARETRWSVPRYSVLKTTMGSVLAARRAGR